MSEQLVLQNYINGKWVASASGKFRDVPDPATAEILAIKRLQNSSVYNPSASAGGGFESVVNSDQFQANAQASIVAPVSGTTSLIASVALPMLNRTVNVDGLTRTFTASLGFQYIF